MPIADTDLEFRYSGGTGNTDPDAALGGAMSTAGGGEIVDDTLNNLMDDISSAEAAAGIIIYRGLYIKNAHGSLTYEGPKIWIESQTSSGDTALAMAVADEDASATIETIADEETAPSGPSFTAPANFAAGLAIGATGDGNLDAGEYRGFWLEYTVSSGASAVLDTMTIAVQGDTLP